MTRTQGFLLAILAVLVAVWVSSSATMPGGGPVERRAPATATGPQATPAFFELDPVMTRLNQRLRAADAAVRPPTRNPFRFAADQRASREPAPARPIGTAAPAPVVAATPTVSLIGVVVRTVDGKPLRVGVVSMAETLSYVTAGDRLGTRYEVLAVSGDAIELKDTTDGTIRRVAMP